LTNSLLISRDADINAMDSEAFIVIVTLASAPCGHVQ